MKPRRPVGERNFGTRLTLSKHLVATLEKTKPTVMQTAFGLLLVTICGCAIGFGVSRIAGKDAGSALVPATAAPVHDGATKDQGSAAEVQATGPATSDAGPYKQLTADELKEVVLVPVPPITSNLSAPETVWIRLEGSVALKANAVGKPNDIAQFAAARIVSYIRTLKLADIEGPSGYLALESDLNEIVSSATEGQARAFLISGFIVE